MTAHHSFRLTTKALAYVDYILAFGYAGKPLDP